MPTIEVKNLANRKVGTVELREDVFGARVNENLLHEAVRHYLASLRRGTHQTKTRGEVSGGGKKPWRQKGTGRARHGSIRSPIWKGGGVTHGPRADKNYTKKINKKMARRALHTVLSAKARDNEIIVLDEVYFPEAKTKHAAALFRKFSATDAFAKIMKGNGALVALAGKDDAARRALRNLPYVAVDEARNLNAYMLLQHKFLVLPKEAITLLK